MNKSIKLHLGCGNRRIPDYINVDIREELNPDVVDNIYTLEKFQPNSVDVIYNSHVFEHIDRHNRIKVLQRWLDILKPGGILRISVPDFESIVKAYQNGWTLPYLISFLNGSQKHPFDIHYYCYDFDCLKNDLMNAGFIGIRRYDWRTTEHAEVDDYSQAYLPHMDKEHGLLMSLNIEAIKSSL